MNHTEIAAYLTAAAWADGPITAEERNLVENLLFSLGLERAEAAELLKPWEFKAPDPSPLTSLTERGAAVSLLRALLILSYSDGHFGIDELPYLTKILDKFKIATEEVVQLRIQAHYYLDPEADSVEIPEALVATQQWQAVETAASQAKTSLRQEKENAIRKELHEATEETLLLILYRGRSFDLGEARSEFEQRRGDLLERHGAHHDDGLLRAQTALLTLAKWERMYAARCQSCALSAPGRKGDLCPRCSEDYR